MVVFTVAADVDAITVECHFCFELAAVFDLVLASVKPFLRVIFVSFGVWLS